MNFISSFLDTEIDLFVASVPISPITKEQDCRGLAIAYISYMFKHDIEENIKLKIKNTLDSYQSSDDPTIWHRLLGLHSANIILNPDHSDNSRVILESNVSHHNQSVRNYCTISLAIAIPILQSEFDLLKGSILANMRASHFFAEESIFLYLLSKDFTSDKKQWVFDVLDPLNLSGFNNKNNSDEGRVQMRRFFEEKKEIYTTTYYLDWFGDIKTYLISKLIGYSQIVNEQTLFEPYDSLTYTNWFEKLLNHPFDCGSF